MTLTHHPSSEAAAKEPLSLYQCGSQDCPGGHRYGPAVRDHYLIHCVFQGRGRFETAGQDFELEAGQGFLIVPGQVTVYTADLRRPWRYHWVGFSGGDAGNILEECGLSAEQPVFTLRNPERARRCLEELEKRFESRANAFSLLSGLYGFFALLRGEEPPDSGSGSRLLDTAVDYMRKNYSYPLTVEAVARRCGVDRSHLFRLFKQHLQLSPQQYLIRLRLNKAEELLQTTSLSVSEVAFSCGFNDLCHFSRLFKRRFGVPPSARRLPNS